MTAVYEKRFSAIYPEKKYNPLIHLNVHLIALSFAIMTASRFTLSNQEIFIIQINPFFDRSKLVSMQEMFIETINGDLSYPGPEGVLLVDTDLKSDTPSLETRQNRVDEFSKFFDDTDYDIWLDALINKTNVLFAKEVTTLFNTPFEKFQFFGTRQEKNLNSEKDSFLNIKEEKLDKVRDTFQAIVDLYTERYLANCPEMKIEKYKSTFKILALLIASKSQSEFSTSLGFFPFIKPQPSPTYIFLAIYLELYRQRNFMMYEEELLEDLLNLKEDVFNSSILFLEREFLIGLKFDVSTTKLEEMENPFYPPENLIESEGKETIDTPN